MKNKILLILTVFSVCMIGASFKIMQKPSKPWVVPEKYLKMVNPVKADAKSINSGKALFIKNCQDCHGKKGLGDGSKVPDLKSIPPDMTNAVFHAQSDGSIFYKISEGRDDMPRSKKDLPEDEDRWNLVNYVRTLKK
ncbi:MAG: cytochrome c [Bacteroidota bacterium]|nr:cytochrome c [Bacteroidota bacterium]